MIPINIALFCHSALAMIMCLSQISSWQLVMVNFNTKPPSESSDLLYEIIMKMSLAIPINLACHVFLLIIYTCLVYIKHTKYTKWVINVSTILLCTSKLLLLSLVIMTVVYDKNLMVGSDQMIAKTILCVQLFVEFFIAIVNSLLLVRLTTTNQYTIVDKIDYFDTTFEDRNFTDSSDRLVDEAVNEMIN